MGVGEENRIVRRGEREGEGEIEPERERGVERRRKRRDWGEEGKEGKIMLEHRVLSGCLLVHLQVKKKQVNQLFKCLKVRKQALY